MTKYNITKKGHEAVDHVIGRICLAIIDSNNESIKSKFYVKKVNTYFDIMIYSQEMGFDMIDRKIEVKSCEFIVKNGRANINQYRYNKVTYGRFNFTKKENRVMQRKDNVDVCFVLHIDNTYHILGFVKAKTLNAKQYVTIPQLITKFRLKQLDNYISELGENQK